MRPSRQAAAAAAALAALAAAKPVVRCEQSGRAQIAQHVSEALSASARVSQSAQHAPRADGCQLGPESCWGPDPCPRARQTACAAAHADVAVKQVHPRLHSERRSASADAPLRQQRRRDALVRASSSGARLQLHPARDQLPAHAHRQRVDDHTREPWTAGARVGEIGGRERERERERERREGASLNCGA
jgi:hypothetical protein